MVDIVKYFIYAYIVRISVKKTIKEHKKILWGGTNGREEGEGGD
jgi:hypothetical protein